jgi:hypothetical protein
MHMNCCGKTHSRSKSVGTTRNNNRGKSPRNKLEMIDTPKAPVGSTYHVVTVAEDYRWLGDPESDQTRSWARAQDGAPVAPGTAFGSLAWTGDSAGFWSCISAQRVSFDRIISRDVSSQMWMR